MHSTSERSAKDKHHAARFSSSLSFSTNLKFLKVQTSDEGVSDILRVHCRALQPDIKHIHILAIAMCTVICH